ncbi:MAG: hypothetical protein AAFR75_12275 [Pseudomonadota bacterium]
MQPYHIDCLFPADQPTALPIQIDQRPSRASAVLFLALLVPAILIMLVPVLTIGAAAIADPSARDALVAKPWMALQATVGLLLWLGLWLIPLRGFWARLTRGRRIEIADCGRVNVTETGLLGGRRWTGHLQDFDGVSHRVRSSLSGTRHELSLEQQNRSKSLLLQIAPTITDLETVQLARLLKCPVLNTNIDAQPAPAQSVAPAMLHHPDAIAA